VTERLELAAILAPAEGASVARKLVCPVCACEHIHIRRGGDQVSEQALIIFVEFCCRAGHIFEITFEHAAGRTTASVAFAAGAATRA
jgi:hypothetical protein